MNRTLGKNLPNFVSPILKLHNQYCQSIVIMDLCAESFHALVVIAKILTFWFNSPSTCYICKLRFLKFEHCQFVSKVVKSSKVD